MDQILQSLRVNRTVYSWTSSRTRIDGAPYTGIVSIDYEQKRDVKVVWAERQDGTALGWTSGKYSVPAVTMKMLKTTSDSFTTQLTVKGLGSYGDAEFPLVVQCVEPLSGAQPLTAILAPCRVVGKKDAYEEGIDELLDEYTLACLAVTENGKRLWSAIRGIGV